MQDQKLVSEKAKLKEAFDQNMKKIEEANPLAHISEQALQEVVASWPKANATAAAKPAAAANTTAAAAAPAAAAKPAANATKWAL